MLTQEGYGTEFVDDSNIFNSGMNITKDMVGSSQPGKSTEYENRLYAAKAGINGAWYNWFGLFSEGDNTVNFSSITQVYPRLKLVKSIPNWDNLNNIPLANRSWDGNVYQSTQNGQPQSYISSDVMYSRQWKNGKLFVVFNDALTPIKLNPNETIASIQCTDGYFIESGDCTADFTITDVSGAKQLKLKSTVVIPTDTTNGQIKGVGYIITTAGGSSFQSSSSVSQTSSSSSSIPASSSLSSAKFSINDRVIATVNINVRSSPLIPTGYNNILGVQSKNSYGAVVFGPISLRGYNWQQK